MFLYIAHPQEARVDHFSDSEQPWLLASETLDGAFCEPTLPEQWPPSMERVWVEDVKPANHWRSEKIWHVAADKYGPGSGNKVSLREILGARANSIGLALHAMATASTQQFTQCRKLERELGRILGRTSGNIVGDERDRTTVFHWAEESMFRKLDGFEGRSAYDMFLTPRAQSGINPYALRAVTVGLAAYDHLTNSDQAVVDEALKILASHMSDRERAQALGIYWHERMAKDSHDAT